VTGKDIEIAAEFGDIHGQARDGLAAIEQDLRAHGLCASLYRTRFTSRTEPNTLETCAKLTKTCDPV
jgi:hypothetical protein